MMASYRHCDGHTGSHGDRRARGRASAARWHCQWHSDRCQLGGPAAWAGPPTLTRGQTRSPSQAAGGRVRRWRRCTRPPPRRRRTGRRQEECSCPHWQAASECRGGPCSHGHGGCLPPLRRGQGPSRYSDRLVGPGGRPHGPGPLAGRSTGTSGSGSERRRLIRVGFRGGRPAGPRQRGCRAWLRAGLRSCGRRQGWQGRGGAGSTGSKKSAPLAGAPGATKTAGAQIFEKNYIYRAGC
jgi:hypothetical protein